LRENATVSAALGSHVSVRKFPITAWARVEKNRGSGNKFVVKTKGYEKIAF
jgi:hypothetical protein